MSGCFILENKFNMPKQFIEITLNKLRRKEIKKINLMWIEANGCSGNIISLMNAYDPTVVYFLQEMVNMTYNNSFMADEGEMAYERFLETLDTEFILVVEGAISLKDEGMFTVIANYKGEPISAAEAVALAAEKAKYVIAVGSCACYGGPTAANPNPSESVSVYDFIGSKVIRCPGCPSHPKWVIGTIAHILSFGMPALDEQNRPILFYGITIHDLCPRRSYFDKGIFAKNLGDKECMIKLGCKGPRTKTDCPLRRWNHSDNWPVGDNTPCIGCANSGFPDADSPFVRY